MMAKPGARLTRKMLINSHSWMSRDVIGKEELKAEIGIIMTLTPMNG
jgi:hypothetical protein